MDLLEDETPTGGPDFHLAADVFADLFGRALNQNLACVATAAPEGKPGAKVTFQAGRFHTPAIDLYRINRIQPGADEVRQQLPDATAAVEHDFEMRGALFDHFPHETLTGLEELAVHHG